MIFGIGTDVLEIDRIQSPELLAKKVLTSSEMTKFAVAKNQRNFIAQRFSAKEAVAKALGVGIGKSLAFKDIEISKDENGKPICKIK
jgi:holo-[acyl-carrier protein] synthase